MVDVLVAGAGPAGLAIASACAQEGLRTALVAPRPSAPWPATYALWADEVTSLPAGTRYVTARPRVHTGTERRLPREYAVLDNESLRTALTHPEVEVLTGRLADHRTGAKVVIDATGTHQPGQPGRPEQTAFGMIVPAALAAPLLTRGEAIFMDWRGPAGEQPTFLYAIPLPDGQVLLEETSLAARPAPAMTDLRRKLLARLATHGINPPESPTDRVRIPLDRPPQRPGVIPFGAAAGLVHPATGYSVADSLRLAPQVAAAIHRAGPHRAMRAAHRVIWPPAARAVYRLRQAGLATLLALPPERTPEFFALFFSLPASLQRAYLSERDNLPGTLAAMAVMFRRASPQLRRLMARSN